MPLPRVRPDGFAVTVILSMLATAGFCCVLIDGLHISAAAALAISASRAAERLRAA